jgi:hypothetical protein
VTFLWAINAAQADTFGAVAVQDFDGVAVEDTDYFCGEIGRNSDAGKKDLRYNPDEEHDATC